MMIPTLETPRLLIREFVPADLDTIHAILKAGFGDVPLNERREWLDWTVRNYVALARLYQPPYGDRGVVLRETGTLIGAVGLVPSFGPFNLLPSFQRAGEPPDRFHEPQFGLFWAIAPEHQRRGYAVEAVQALIDFAFTTLNLRHIVATAAYENAASVGVMRKLGMQIERNPTPGDPPWFQMVGVLKNPALRATEQ